MLMNGHLIEKRKGNWEFDMTESNIAHDYVALSHGFSDK
jgi:hypothetical protein